MADFKLKVFWCCVRYMASELRNGFLDPGMNDIRVTHPCRIGGICLGDGFC